MSIKQVDSFLEKNGKRKKISKFAKHKEDIIYMYQKGATYEIITQYLETKGITRTKSYTPLYSYIQRNLRDEIIEKKSIKSVEKTEKKSTEKDEDTSEKREVNPQLMHELLNREIEL